MSVFWRTVKNAFRTVLYNWREYAGFFLALLVVQSIFWSLTFSLDTNNMIAKQTVEDSYSYHVEISNLDQTQLALFKNMLSGQSAKDDSFYEVQIVEGGEVSRAYVTLKGADIASSFAKFQDRCMKRGWEYSLTPLYTYVTEYVTPGIVRYVLISLCMLLLCAAVLTVLYNIRIENHQFQYGIYMTCGGSFARLFRVAFWELCAIGILTFLPSMLFSAVIMLAVYLPEGVLFCFDWAAPLKVLLLGTVTVFLSVLVPVSLMARKTPMALITSRDNAGLVSSPRRSFRLVGKSFPRDYELAGMWRMRKYYVRLVCSAVAFASLFISGLYISDMIKTNQNLAVDEFLLAWKYLPEDFPKDEDGNVVPPVYTREDADAMNDDVDYLSKAIRDLPGVAYVNADAQMRADDVIAHMLLQTENAPAYGEYGVLSKGERDGYEIATNSYQYTCVDETWLENAMASGLYTFEGDPYAVLTDPHAIIVSEKIFGAQCFDFSIGDSVYFASYVNGTIPKDAPMYTRRNQILLQQLEYFTFDYGTKGDFTGQYRVCAVITQAPSSEYLTVGMCTDTYRSLSGDVGARNMITVYLEDGLSLARADEIAKEVSTLAGDFAWQYRRNGVFFDDLIADARRDHLIAAVISAFILTVSPMVWFFSQILFYRRREGEFSMLRAMGGFDREIGALHLTAGAVLSVVAFLITLGMSYLFNWVIYIAMSQILPSLGIVKAVNYNYFMPLWALALCAAVSVICGFVSCLVPYAMWKHRTKSQRAAQEKQNKEERA